MDSFPLLSSGAVSQYPTQALRGQGIGIIRFLDGSDQRFLHTPRNLRRWCIELSLLSDAEIASLELFFNTHKGVFSPFVFTDPASNSQIPNCRFATSEMNTEYVSVNANSTSIWIMETNG
jgi:hypothetical protein